MSKAYKLSDNKTNIIFFKVSHVSSCKRKPIDNHFGDVINGRPFLTFGVDGINNDFLPLTRFNGCVNAWNTSYKDCEEVKNNEILIKKVEYSISTFQELYDNLVNLNLRDGSKEISYFYNYFCDETHDISYDVRTNSKILIFKGGNFTLNVLYKGNFAIIDVPPSIYDDCDFLDFTPKDLKLKNKIK